MSRDRETPPTSTEFRISSQARRDSEAKELHRLGAKLPKGVFFCLHVCESVVGGLALTMLAPPRCDIVRLCGSVGDGEAGAIVAHQPSTQDIQDTGKPHCKMKQICNTEAEKQLLSAHLLVAH